jgi:hypothetical protein
MAWYPEPTWCFVCDYYVHGHDVVWIDGRPYCSWCADRENAWLAARKAATSVKAEEAQAHAT